MAFRDVDKVHWALAGKQPVPVTKRRVANLPGLRQKPKARPRTGGRSTLWYWIPLGVVLILLSGYGLLVGLNRQTLNFEPISGPILNPLMGWAPWATIKEIKQPHTLVYADLTWREFEPQQGVYDFDSFEKKNQIARWRAENKRVVLRFVCDKPGPESHMDIPDWLFKAINGDGDRYANSYGRGFSPNYANPLFIQYHGKAIQALGERYAEDSLIAYMELGSLGHWGEWHVAYTSRVRRMPETEIRDQYVRQYVEAFPNTFLLMRRPFAIAKELKLGLYNDMTGEPNSTRQWLDWIANGGDYDQTGEADALVVMDNAWQTAPVGGEQSPELEDTYLYSKALDQTLHLLEESHTTFVGPHSPVQIAPGSSIQAGLDQALEQMGYRIYIQQVRMPRWLIFSKTLNVSLTFANDGVAPIYYNWPVALYVYDEAGSLIKTDFPKMDLRKILPGKPFSTQLSTSLDGLAPGNYTLGFAILDPVSRAPAVRLAMANAREDLIWELGTVEVVSLKQLLIR